MYNNDELDWSKLETEHTVYIQVPQVKKLPEGIFVCPECRGSGRRTAAYRDPGPNKMDKCFMCDGTGEIVKCSHANCNNHIPNVPHRYPTKLCFGHERERIYKIYRDAVKEERRVFTKK